MTRRPIQTVATELLVLRCQDGDERALAVLYEHWGPRLTRHAIRLTGRRDAAGDVCQDVWLAIARGIARLDDPARFPAWAYRIVTRRCADWIRNRTRDRRLVALEDVPATVDPGRADDDDVARLLHAMRRLPGDHQVALALFYGDDLTVGQIAAALDIPPGTVKSRLHHARRALSTALERSAP